MRVRAFGALVLLVVIAAGLAVSAQQAPSGDGAVASPRAMAPVDFTGVWVSVVSEDWRWRMMHPAPGDYTSVPLTPEGRAVADMWDPSRDAATGEECRAYAAPAIMRIPGRLRIAWEDDYTLRIEADAGTQTRRLQFQRPGAAQLASDVTAPREWQGFSVARWEPQPAPATGGGFGGGAAAPATTRTLEVTTTHIRPGYLRSNGVPFSEETVLTEYFDAWSDASGEWFTVTTVVRDPRYLRQLFVTTTDFRREPDDSGWAPTACQVPT